MITKEKIQQKLHYNPETGIFTWKVPTGGKMKGEEAGFTTDLGYRRIRVFGKLYLAHRLAWLCVYGEWPKGEIDHINRNGCDNRVCNLRLANRSENNSNRSKNSNNTSGITGVTWDKDLRKWRARIDHYAPINLGVFDNIFDAACARRSAENRYKKEFSPNGA